MTDRTVLCFLFLDFDGEFAFFVGLGFTEFFVLHFDGDVAPASVLPLTEVLFVVDAVHFGETGGVLVCYFQVRAFARVACGIGRGHDYSGNLLFAF